MSRLLACQDGLDDSLGCDCNPYFDAVRGSQHPRCFHGVGLGEQSELAAETSKLKKELADCESRSELVGSFLQDYQLSTDEVAHLAVQSLPSQESVVFVSCFADVRRTPPYPLLISR